MGPIRAGRLRAALRTPAPVALAAAALPLALAAAAPLLAACAPPREPAALVDPSLWEAGDADDAAVFGVPYPADPAALCLPGAVFAEEIAGEPSLTIDLAACAFAVIAQPTRAEIEAGDLLDLRVWHDAIFFVAADGVRVALALGEAVAWSTTLPAPGDSGLDAETWEAADPLPAGAAARLLVDARIDVGARHGGDSMNVIELTRRDPRWEPEE